MINRYTINVCPQYVYVKYASGMTRTMIDLDDELVAKAAKELGTATKKDTVHAALRAALRQSAARELRAMMTGDRDGLTHEMTVNAMWSGGEQSTSG